MCNRRRGSGSPRGRAASRTIDIVQLPCIRARLQPCRYSNRNYETRAKERSPHLLTKLLNLNYGGTNRSQEPPLHRAARPALRLSPPHRDVHSLALRNCGTWRAAFERGRLAGPRKCAPLFPRSHPEAYRRRRTIPVPAPESAALERIRACVFENGDYAQCTPERVLRVMSLMTSGMGVVCCGTNSGLHTDNLRQQCASNNLPGGSEWPSDVPCASCPLYSRFSVSHFRQLPRSR